MDRIRTGMAGSIALALLLASCAGENEVPDEPVRSSEPVAETQQEAQQQTLATVMDGLRADMARLSEALWRGDYLAVAEAAQAVGDHPQVGAEERLRVQSTLGDEFPDFAAADRHVHDVAMTLRDAARRQDTTVVLGALSELQRGCIACHGEFRERLAR